MAGQVSEPAAGALARGTSLWHTLAVLAIVTSIPLIQLGANVYWSFQVFAFAVLFTLVITRRALAQLPMFALLMPLMCLSLLPFVSAPLAMHSFLKVGREWLCLCVLLAALGGAAVLGANLRYPHALVVKIVAALAAALFAGVLAQYVLLHRGVLWFVPADYFVTNAGTIPTPLDLKYSALRPSGPFGEPSYAGFIATSFLMVVLYAMRTSLLKLMALTCIVGTVVFCQTFAGMAAVFLVLATYFITGQHSRAELRLGMACAVISLLILTSSGHFYVLGRIAQLTNPAGDVSGYARLVVPSTMVADILTSYPLGLPTDQIGSVFGQRGLLYSESLQGAVANGFMNVIINYGLVGMGTLLLVLRSVRYRLVPSIYLITASMFNGSIFSYDKVAVIGLVFMLINYAGRPAPDAVSQAPPFRNLMT